MSPAGASTRASPQPVKPVSKEHIVNKNKSDTFMAEGMIKAKEQSNGRRIHKP